MSLFLAELRKVWGNRLFPLLLAVLAAANLLLLWMGTRPTAGQPSADGQAVVPFPAVFIPGAGKLLAL